MLSPSIKSKDLTGLARLISPGNRMKLLLLTLLIWIVFAPFISDASLLSVLLMVVIVAAAATVASSRRAVITAVF